MLSGKNMERSFLTLLLLLLLNHLVISQTNSSADLTKLRYLKEVEWPKAYREQDTVLLDRILAKEFQMISGDGTWSDKKKELAYISQHKPSYKSFHFEIRRLEIFENNTAVISGVGHIRSVDANGNPTYSTYHSSNILIKRAGVWKAINSHVSGFTRIE